jgi:glycosyltransferase involved in cell wall biosynthesis
MKVAFFTAAVSRKNGGSSSVVDLSLAALKIGRLSSIYSPLGGFDYFYYRASGSNPLFCYTKYIDLDKYADKAFGGISQKAQRLNRLISLGRGEILFEPNTIYIDDLGVSIRVADDIRKCGGCLILNHAGSPAAFINHFGCAKSTKSDLRLERYKYLLARYDYCLFQSQSQIEEYNNTLSAGSNFPRALLMEPSCYEPDIREAVKKKLHLSDTFLNIVVVGTIQPRKNQFALIEVCRELIRLKTSPKFHIVGGVVDRTYYIALTQAIEESNLAEYFTFYGHRRNYLQVMAGCSIVLQPSLEEGVSRILRESLALGKPVIAYNVTGTNGFIQSCVTGYLVDVHDTASMAYFCKQLNDFPDLYNNISNACTLLFEKNYSMRGLSMKLSEVIYNVSRI